MTARVIETPITKEDSWTYERYRRETAEGEYFAVIGGRKIVSPSPTTVHQLTLGNIYVLIREFVRHLKLGQIFMAPFDVVFASSEFTPPDVLFVATENLGRLTDNNLQGAPDLIVEVLSPGTVKVDRTIKRDLFARNGVREYWLVSPGDRTVEVLVLREGRYELLGLFEEGDEVSSEVLPEFTCSCKAVFGE